MRRTGFAALVLIVSTATQLHAQETRLLCTGVHSGTTRQPAGERTNPTTGVREQQYVNIPYQTELVREIRFNESTNEFWFRDGGVLDAIKGDRDGDGWIAAKRVVFDESTIEAEFDRSLMNRARNFASLGLARLFEGKPIGTLDRYSGVFRLMGRQLLCSRSEPERRF